MTVAVICVTVAAVAFLGAARHLWRASEFGDAAATVMFSVGVWLSVLGCLLLRHLVTAAPLWTFVVVALSGVPVASAPILVTDLRWRPPTIAPPEPVGACQRCGNQLWDRDGNHRYTDHDRSYLCPPEHWQSGQHRLHQLPRPDAAEGGPSARPTPDSTDPAPQPRWGNTMSRR
jgi:hypothetical protein